MKETQEKPGPPEELQLLQVFKGKWRVENVQNNEAPSEDNTLLAGEESYEWLVGNYFLIYRWYRKFTQSRHQGIGVMGYDEAARSFSITNYDNLGFARTYEITQEQNRWHYAGEQERAVFEFSDDGKSFVQTWEILQNSEWKPLCKLLAKKEG